MSNKLVPLELLADPVRRRVLEHLDREGPAPLATLAEAAEVHVNTARGHLAALEDAGIVAREQLSTGTRGRPPLRYRLADGWRLPSGDFKALADLLAASVSSLAPTAKQLHALGHEWGRYLAGRPGTRPARELIAPCMAELGFDTTLSGELVLLSGCPCRLVLPDRPELVCRLAAAVVDGLASSSTDRLKVRSSVHDPHDRRCRLRLGPSTPRRARRLSLHKG